ncbi:MAG: membrane protein insertase YidC [Cellvibrionaceae bacterium]|nr:membrane protein insertase YidC [Cellvibrionaceae bacterium]MCV6627467.1 membrane protein insertase YidC [Cellvibrionaceae bacterium]
MDWQKYLLIIGMAVTSYMLVLEWNDFQQRKQALAAPAPQAEQTLASPVVGSELPSPVATPAKPASDIPQGDVQYTPAASQSQSQLVTVKTDTLELIIDSHGGDIVKAALLTHDAELNRPELPFIILNRTADKTYVAQSGIIGPNATDTAKGRPSYQVKASEFTLGAGEENLAVDLVLQQGDVTITKRFNFSRGEHLVKVQYLIDNKSSTNWKGNYYAQIKRDRSPVATDASALGLQPYLGAALTTPEDNYKKVDFEDLDEESFKVDVAGGWVAMVQHYFLSAWVADPEQTNKFHLRKIRNSGMYTFGYTAPQTLVEPGQLGVIKSEFYVGPKDVYRLEEIAPYLDLTVDYGWLWWVAKPLFFLMNWIQGFVGNWGWSIVVLTLIVKAAFFKLTATSYRSMANMRKLQPKMQQLKDLYGDDRQKMSQETMKLYQKEKVNPLGGCLPILVQMPVFIALYWVLSESVELRHAPFILWIEDLSVKDPYFILPLIMGATQWFMMKLNPTPPDPMQAKIMSWMPIVFTFLFMWFPAGLVLYWVVNNTISMIQQYIITKQIEADA